MLTFVGTIPVMATGISWAEVGATSVRELIGLVNRLIAFQAVGGGTLTPEAARTLLADELPAAPPAKAERAPAPAAAPAAEPDEFASFLSAISTTVAQTVEAWRSRIGEAVLRWQGEGFRTTRLEQLLLSDEVPDVGSALADYAARAEELQRLLAEAVEYDPAAAGNNVFHDPDRLEEARAVAERVKAGVEPPPPPSRGLSFTEFIEGKANEAAVRAARAVVQEPGKRFNPLFVTGPSGSGKTHLLHAVGNALLAARSGAIVACLSAQAFTDELVQAINAGRIEWWRRRFRRADALLLDDVQLLAGRDATQEELFNLFNAFADAEKQLAFSADRLPGQLAGLAPRLTTRFEGGLAVELAPPDRTMRAEMIRRLLVARSTVAEIEAVEYLAARPADSARAVQGLVNRAIARMDPSAETLTAQAARLAIEGRSQRPSQAQAVSAVVPAGLDPVMGSREKVVWDWPGATERLVEELR